MFGKVIVFGLFELLKKKRRVRTASLGPSSDSKHRLGTTTRVVVGTEQWR